MMTRIFGALIASVLAAASAQAQTTAFFYDSQPGDVVGRGESAAIAPGGDLTFSAASWSSPSSLEIQIRHSSFFDGSWSLFVESPAGASLEPGVYENARRSWDRPAVLPGLHVMRNGISCGSSRLVGRFVVYEIAFDEEGTLTAFAADFEQHCTDTAPALFGAIRYRSSRSSLVPFDGAYPTFALNVTPPVNGTVEGAGINCGGAGSDCDEVYLWPQDVTLQAIADSGYVFAGWTGDCYGGAVTTVSVARSKTCQPIFDVAPESVGTTAPDLSAGALVLDVPDDYPLAGGLRHIWTTADATFTPLGGFGRTVTFVVNTTAGEMFLSLAAPGGAELSSGDYPYARSFEGLTYGVAALTFRAQNSYLTCSSARGRFRVYEVAFNGPMVTSLAVDFEVHCDGRPDAVAGALRYNSTRASLLPFDGAYPVYALHVSSSAGGHVTGGGIDCGGTRTTCAQSYAGPSGVALEAAADAGYMFLGWTGDCTGTTAVTRVVVAAPSRCGAAFHPAPGQSTLPDPAFAEAALLLQETSGEGTQRLWLPDTAAFRIAFFNGRQVAFRVENADGFSWFGSFTAPDGDLAPGTYDDATQRGASPLFPVMSVGSCSSFGGYGRFHVYEITTDGLGDLTSFAADFEQHCENPAAATFGAIRYRSSRAALLPFDGAAPEISLRIDPSPFGHVTGAGIDCGPAATDCSETFTAVSDVTLHAIATAGYAFGGWTGRCEGAATTTLTVRWRTRCKPQFYRLDGSAPDNQDLRDRALLLVTDPEEPVGQPGRRRLWSAPGLFMQLTAFLDPRHVQLHVIAPDGASALIDFVSASSGPLHLQPGEFEGVTAHDFSGSPPNPRFRISGTLVHCSPVSGRFRIYEIDVGSSVTPKAFAADFDVRCSGLSPSRISGAIRFNAARASVDPFGDPAVDFASHMIAGTVTGLAGGSIAVDPGGLSCASSCIAPLAHGTAVTLTAVPASGSRFTGWSGACAGTSVTCTLTMSAHRNVVAAFEPHTVPVVPEPLEPTGPLTTNFPTLRWRASFAATWYYLAVDDSTGPKVRRWMTNSEANCATGTGTCSAQAGALASGHGSWRVLAWNPAGSSAWSAALPIYVPAGSEATVLSLYRVGDVVPGGTATLWAYVKNTGLFTLWTGARVWFRVDGPSWTGEHWVGSTELSGLDPNATRWVRFDWVVPANRGAGAHTFTARVYLAGSGPISPFSGTQAFRVLGPTAVVDALYPVSGATRGGTAALWARVTNPGTTELPSNAKVWYYVDGPSWGGTHWVGFAEIGGLDPGETRWYRFEWPVPAGATPGTYTYWAQVWAGGAISPWSAPQHFTVNP